MPAVTPVTPPEEETEAMAALLLLQAPPLVPSERVVDAPVQSVVVPVIAATVGRPPTVIVFTTYTEPQLLVTV